ncbi:MAG: YXWGXW repeat-containing protein [Limisphaerales bacterium]
MKTKIAVVAALFGAAVMSANAGVRFGLSVGFPQTVVAAPPVICAPPIPVAPAPETVVQTIQAAPAPVVEVIPACPGVGYVWSPGYWDYRPTGRVWVTGAWAYHPDHFRYDFHHYRDHGHRR